MGQDIKREARKQYLKYFRVWFIIVGCLFVIGALVMVGKLSKADGVRGNDKAPTERVYDNADVLTAEEEEALRSYIAECEAKVHVDIVLVTVAEDMEGTGSSWDTAMMNYADDFYDYNNYGYDKVHGDGALLLDNWYEGQEGSWLSTCGRVYDWFGDYEINRVLDVVYYEVEDNPYEAYKAYVTQVTEYMNESDTAVIIPWIAVIFVPLVVALIYAFANLHQKAAADTTTSTTYIAGGRPNLNVRRDDFIRKNVVTRRIQTSSSSGGSRSGGGGSHRSSSGVRHGGGGRRR